MIKILIMDDSPNKVEKIRKFLVEDCQLHLDDISVGSNIGEGRKLLMKQSYDLLLLDLVMPADDDSEARSEESINFLRELGFNNLMKKPIHIIGFSQFDEAIEKNTEEFEESLWSLVKFDFGNNDWKDKLRVKICHLIDTKKEFKAYIENENKFDLGIICALERPELAAVLALPCNWQEFNLKNDPLIYHRGEIESKSGKKYSVVACSTNKMGMHAAATISTMMIAKFEIKELFMVGICAGIRESGVNFGDVIVADGTLDYGFGKLKENSSKETIFEPAPQQILTKQGILSKIQNFNRDAKTLAVIYAEYKSGNKPNNQPSVVVGTVASGSYVVQSPTFLAGIVSRDRKLKGVDMEGYGVYMACHFFDQTSSLFIKSVSDFGDEKKDDNYQDYAAYTSANYLYQFIRSQY
jgi:nucleoside phosphorylase/CheY-like chemotaxis protein